MNTNADLGHDEQIARLVRIAPMVMSALALAVVLEAVAEFGTHRPADEDWHAHVFQLLMILQIPMMLALGLISRRPLMKSAPVLAFQLGLWLVAFAAVHVLSL